jgi:secretion/DNA translocation related TadE-like protein
VLVAILAVGVEAAVVAHRKAQAAADLAALAGATALRDGRDPCGVAAQVAIANGVTTQTCATDGSGVEVSVVVRLPEVLGNREVRARARAARQPTLPRTRLISIRSATRATFSRGCL